MDDQVSKIKIDKGDIPLLVQGNWNLWKGSVLLALEEAGVDDVLCDNTPYDSMGAELRQRSKIVRAAMLRRINREERTLLQHDGTLTAKNVWDRLHESYGIHNAATSLRILGKYRTLKKTANETVMQYYTRALSLASELRESGENISETDMVATIMNGLPREYNLVKTTINASGVMPALDRLKMILINEESNMIGDGDMPVHGSTQYDQGEISSQPSFARLGHAKQRKKFTGKCYKCGKKGHMARQCRETFDESKEGKSLRVGKQSNLSIGDWILDSGASDHMTGDASKFDDGSLKQAFGHIILADGRSTAIAGKGKVTINIGTMEMQLSDVLYVPSIAFNLLSAVKVGSQTGTNIIMRNNGTCALQKDGDIVELHTQADGVYALRTDADVWHTRLGHASARTLKQLGLPHDVETCEACVKAKLNRKPYSSDVTIKRPLDRISMDVLGPVTPETVGGQNCALVAIDAATKFSIVTLLPNKGQAADAAKQAILWFEQLSGKYVKCIRTDCGKEFLQEQMKEWLSNKGINHETTAGYEPQQNGQAERLNRTLMEGTRALLEDTKLPTTLWGEAMRTINYVRNLKPCNINGKQSKCPFELLTGKQPDYQRLKRWGCKALVHVPQDRRVGKLAPRAEPAVFIGYSNSTTYRFLVKKRVVTSRTAVFFEDQIGELDQDFQSGTLPQLLMEPNPLTHMEESVDTYVDTTPSESFVKTTSSIREVSNNEKAATNDTMENNEQGEILPRLDDEQDLSHDTVVQDYPTDNEDDQVSTQHEVERDQVKCYNLRERKPMDYKQVATKGLHVNTSLLPDEFSGYEEAMSRPDKAMWKQAVEEEKRALLENETYEVTELPHGRKALQTKWVFKVKRDNLGNVERYRARLVVKGYQQREGIDYTDIFSPVVSKPAVRLFLTVAAIKDYDIHQLDIKAAFLHANLREEIYMAVPEGIIEDPRKVYKLKKSLYGLKQAPREWNKELISFLSMDLECKCASVDETLLICRKKNEVCYVCVYVDDILLASSSKTLQQTLIKEICKRFKVGSMGEINTFCGMQVKRDRLKKILHLSEPLKIERMIEEYGMCEAKEKRVPISENLCEEDDECDPKIVSKYQQLVGQLLYLSTTVRPDLGFAAAALSRFMSRPSKRHWAIAKDVIRYLKGTKYHGIYLGNLHGASDITIEGYCDADYATDKETRRSRTGYLFLVNGSLIDWRSQLQSTVATSTAEAEYMSLAECVKKALWFRTLLAELLGVEAKPVSIYCDNQSTLHMAKDLNCVSRTKHIDVRHHFVRERGLRGEMHYVYCPSENMLADYLTKLLRPEKFREIMGKLGVQEN